MVVTQLSSERRQVLLSEFANARAETDKLFGIVMPEALYDRPIPERHRIAFYIGHLEAFDWNLFRNLLGLTSFQADLDHLFAFGIDPVDGGLPTDQASDWPTIDQIEAYRDSVRRSLDRALGKLLAEDDSDVDHLLNVAIEHRLMHSETLAYMFHQLPFNRKLPVKVSHPSPLGGASPEMVLVPAGRATLGMSRVSGAFGWDNEFESWTVHVPEFAVDRFKVTNREFEEFVNAGGYEHATLWSDRDWAWRNACNIDHPVFWKRRGDSWTYRTMFEEIPLAPDWPVYVSHAEASAYARWAGKALPTEAQWHRAAYATFDGAERAYLPGEPASFDDWDPAPVHESPSTQSDFRVEGLMREAWEWTSSVFEPFPGFQPFPFYEGYSAPFFDGQHFVLKGGSVRTAPRMLRRSFRNWFQGHYQYAYTGFRCVTPAAT